MCLHTVRLESAEQPLWFDRHTPWTPAGHTLKQQDSEELAKRKSALCCVQCQHVITEHAARLELAGGHLHVFTNPGGFVYEIALYEYADCVMHGPATTDYSWFPGYAWQLALCANCHEHLGWRYRKTGSAAFYGLIRDRLVEVNP
jgi:hypothetical protein